jgi:hypothetical protein
LGLIWFLIGCSRDVPDFSHLPKEDQMVYEELYKFYIIIKKTIDGELEIPLQGKVREEYLYYYNKYSSDDIVLTDKQKYLYGLIYSLMRIDFTDKSNKSDIENYILEIEKFFAKIRNPN